MPKNIILLICVMLSSSQSFAQLPVFDVQGHRGARGVLPENSIIGFIRALDYGVSTLEMDVVITHDNLVVVSHEPWMNYDICSSPFQKFSKQDEKNLNIYKMKYERVAEFDCGAKGNPMFPSQVPYSVAKPLLSDVIVEVENHIKNKTFFEVEYNIEIKSTPQTDHMYHPPPAEYSDIVYELIDQYLPLERVVIQSFDVRVLQYWHRQYPNVRLALLVENKRTIQSNIKVLGFTPHIYSPYYKLIKRADVAWAHQNKMKMIPWTVNEHRDMLALKGLGVDGIITDYPDRAQQYKMTLDIPYHH